MSQVDAIKTFGGGNRTSQLHAQSSQLNRFGAASVSGAPAVSFGRNSDHFSGGAPSQSGFLGDIFKSIGSWVIWPWNWFGGGSNSADQSSNDTSYHAPPVQEAPKPQPVHTSHPAPVREEAEAEEKPAQRTPAPVEPDPIEPPTPAETTKPVQPAAKETRADNGDRHLEMLDVVNRVRALDNKTLTSIIFNGNSQIAAASPSAVTAEQKAAVAKALNISEAEAMPVIMMVRSLMAIATAPIEAKGGAHQNSVSVDPVAANPAAAKAAIKSRLDTLFTPSGKQSLSQRIDDTKLTAMANACVARATNRDYAITGDNQVPFAKLVHQVTDILADHAGQKDDGKIGKDTLQRRQDAISFGEDTPLSVLYKFSASSAPYTTGSAGGIATTVPGVTQADTSIVSRLYANRSQDSQEVLISDNRPEYGAEHAKKAYEFHFYEAYFRDAQPAGQKTPDSKKLKALKVQMARHVLGNIIRDSKGDTTTTSDTIIGDDYKLTRGANSRKYQAAAQRAQEIVEQAITRFQEVGRGKTAAEFEPFSKRIDSVRGDYTQALAVFNDHPIVSTRPTDKTSPTYDTDTAAYRARFNQHKQKQNATRAFLVAMLTNTAPEGVPGVKADGGLLDNLGSFKEAVISKAGAVEYKDAAGTKYTLQEAYARPDFDTLTPINSAGNEAVDYQKALRDASVLYHAVQSTLQVAVDDTSQHHGNNHGRNSGIYKLGSLNTDAKGEGTAGKLAKLVEQVKRNGTQETEGGQLYLQTDGSGKDARQLAGDVIDLLVADSNVIDKTGAVTKHTDSLLASIGFDTIMRAAPVTDTAAKADPVDTTKTALRRGFEHSAFETAPVLALYNRPKTDTATEQFIEDFDKSMKAAKAAVRLTSEQTEKAHTASYMADVTKANYEEAFNLVALAISEARSSNKRASEVIKLEMADSGKRVLEPKLYYRDDSSTDTAVADAARNHNTSLYLAHHIIGILEKPAGKSGTTALLSHQRPRPEQTKAYEHYNNQLQAFIDGAKAKITGAADDAPATLTALKFSD